MATGVDLLVFLFLSGALILLGAVLITLGFSQAVLQPGVTVVPGRAALAVESERRSDAPPQAGELVPA